MSTKISHAGKIEAISGDAVQVRILQTSACAACKVASHCNASEAKEKLVEVRMADAGDLKVGDAVTVCASKDVANRALLLGFGLPFLLLVTVLVVMLRVSASEGLAALAALGSLLPYYLLLYLFRDRIQQQLQFFIEK